MAKFTQNVSSFLHDDESYTISDSDEDFIETSVKKLIFVDESNVSESDINVSQTKTPIKNEADMSVSNCLKETVKRLFKKNIISSDDNISDDESNTQYRSSRLRVYTSSDSDETYESSSSYAAIKNKGKKRKDVTHDNTKEDIKELKLNSSTEFLDKNQLLHDVYKQDNDTSCEISELEDEVSHKSLVTIEIDSDSHSEENNELAASLAKKEIGVGNVDPLIAQKRELIVYKLRSLQNELATRKLLFTEGNIEELPDKGKKLRESIFEQEEEIQKLTLELENTPLIQNRNIEDTVEKKMPHLIKRESSFVKDESSSDQIEYSNEYLDFNGVPIKPTTSPELKELGKKAQETRDRELALTVERLQDLHGSLVARPSEDEKVDDPKGLKVPLMPHQKHALAWLLWRENQKPSGGVLADDMGLGKTLTMISLIIATLSDDDSFDKNNDSYDSDGGWQSRPSRPTGGTLVVCPASLLSQWNKEVQDKCKRGLLSVEVYHGSNRESVPKRLSKNDIVITTYNIAARENKNKATLFKINWKRVILDEAHIIRNHKSLAAIAVCEFVTNKRWALTGTPIQNKEMDLYSILKFLRCSPFDDLRVWKRWVDNKNAAGHQRLATVMKSLMLRRTKQELQSTGRLENLPDKSTEEVIVKLDSEEQLVYEKILIYSRTLFAQFLVQRAEKQHMVDLYGGKYDKPTFLSNPNKETQFTKAQKKLLEMHADVKTHEILVLLLRLRQVCCHPSLIHAMLDNEDMMESGILDFENMNLELLRRMSNVSLNESKNCDDLKEEDLGIDRRIAQNVLTAENPVFNEDRVSSKMKALLKVVEEILLTDDKLIIVSQWTAMLDIIASNLCSIKGATFSKFTGNVAIKNRQSVMDAFNSLNSGPKILLLSLTAGGVGLNLVGGNHLLLFDIHWNPQLETQAQDRIYRFGQKKNVYIYKFICSDTIEERVKTLQEHKLAIAQNVLSGEKSKAIGKLTFNDLRSLFAL